MLKRIGLEFKTVSCKLQTTRQKTHIKKAPKKNAATATV
jgi:hypothetical protein